MAFCTFKGVPKGAAGCEVAYWVSPSSTPTSACQSSTTAGPATDTPAARRSFHSSPPQLAARHHLQLRPLPQQCEHHQRTRPSHAQPQPLPQPQPGHPQKASCRTSDSSFVQARLHQHPQPVLSWVPAGPCSGTRTFPTAPSCSYESLPCQAKSLPRSLANPKPHWQQQQQQQPSNVHPYKDALLKLNGRWSSEGASGGGGGGAAAAHDSQTAECRLGMKRAAEHCPLDECQLVRRQRTSLTAAPASGSCSTRPLQRHDSLDSDVTHAAVSSSCGLTASKTATATTLTVVALSAHGATTIAAANNCLTLRTQPPPQPVVRCGPDLHPPGPRQALDAALLFPGCLTLTRGSVGYPTGPLFSNPSPCKGEDFILYAAGVLQLLSDSSTLLALHLWRRTNGCLRLVLSIRHPAAGHGDPRVAVSSYRIHATACLWLAAKLEAQRRVVAEAKVLAGLAMTSPGVLCATELRLLGWLEWCPMRGYLPPAPPPHRRANEALQ